MNICGINLSSEGAYIVTLDENLKVLSKNKIVIGNHEERSALIDFTDTISTYLIVNNIDQVVIKKRALKGKFVGSPISFKMEALIQLMSFPVMFVTAAKIASDVKRKGLVAPSELFKNLHSAYFAAQIGVENYDRDAKTGNK